MARLVGIDRVAARASDSKYAGVLAFIVLVLFVDVPVLSTVGYVRTGREVYMYSLWPVVAGGLVYAVWAVVYLRDKFFAAVDAVDEPGSGGELASILDSRLKHLIAAGWIAGFVLNIWFDPAATRAFLRLEGEVVGTLKYAIMGGIYMPIIAELTFLVVAVHVLLPLRIRLEDVPLDFSDPRRFGGFYPVGELLVRSTMVYFVGLLAWSGQTVVHRFIDSPWPEASQLGVWMFYLLWGALVVSYLFPVLVLNRHMTGQKDAMIEEIQAEIRDLGDDDESIPYTEPPEDEVEIGKHLDRYFKLYHVEQTREYPADFTMVQEVILAALVPVAGHVIVTVLAATGGH